MQIFEYTNKGSRKVNQDYILHRAIDNDKHLFIVADGMGGYTAGEVASKLASESICEFVIAHIGDISPSEILRDAIEFSNEELSFQRYAYGAVQMGTVIVVMLLDGNKAYVSWLGDSRIYQYRKDNLVFQSEDHSAVNELRKVHFLKPEDIERYSAVVARSIMGDDKLGAIDVTQLDVEKGDAFYLCSDGLHKELDPCSLPLNEVVMKSFLDAKSQSFQDNYSLIKVTIE